MSVKPLIDTFRGIDSGRDKFTENFLETTFPALSEPVADIVYYLILIYVGWKVMQWYHGSINIVDTAKTLVFISIIFWFLNWGTGAHWAYKALVDSMDGIARIIAGGEHLEESTTTTIGAFVDKIYYISQRMMGVKWYRMGMIMSGLVLMVTDIMVMTLALAYLTICKIGMAVTMLFFPIYVACLVFSATRQWFYSWLNTMLSFMFTYLLVISLISFLFSSLGTMLNEEIGNPFQIAVDLFNWGGVMIIHVIFFVLLLQARSWAAALTNGAVGSSGVAHQTAAGAKKLIMKLVTKGAA